MGERNLSYTWRGKLANHFTLWEQHDSCIQNAEDAAQALAAARAAYKASEPGSKACGDAHDEIQRQINAQEHWRVRARWFEEKALREEGPRPAPGDPPRAAPPPPAPSAAARPPEPDRRIPEPDDPDDISTFGALDEDPKQRRETGADDELEPGEDWRAGAAP